MSNQICRTISKNGISNCNFHKKKERQKSKNNPTSKTSFLKLLEKLYTVFYVQSFVYNCIPSLLYKSGMHGLSISLYHRLPHININKSNF